MPRRPSISITPDISTAAYGEPRTFCLLEELRLPPSHVGILQVFMGPGGAVHDYEDDTCGFCIYSMTFKLCDRCGLGQEA
jgi:hypothetical protein